MRMSETAAKDPLALGRQFWHCGGIGLYPRILAGAGLSPTRRLAPARRTSTGPGQATNLRCSLVSFCSFSISEHDV